MLVFPAVSFFILSIWILFKPLLIILLNLQFFSQVSSLPFSLSSFSSGSFSLPLAWHGWMNEPVGAGTFSSSLPKFGLVQNPIFFFFPLKLIFSFSSLLLLIIFPIINPSLSCLLLDFDYPKKYHFEGYLQSVLVAPLYHLTSLALFLPSSSSESCL